MLASWMKDTQSNRWSMGIKFVQFSKNRSLHAAINRSPYKAMFGCDPRIGLNSIQLPKDVFLQCPDIIEEIDLNRILSSAKLTISDSSGADQQVTVLFNFFFINLFFYCFCVWFTEKKSLDKFIN